MNNERDDWAQASETVLIFDQWMRAIVGTLRAERGAPSNQFWLLLLISERPQQSAATAAATLGLNYTTMAACAAQLVRKGALEKRTCDDDNRYSPLAITPAGQRLLASLDQSLITAAKSALDPLQGNERTQALQLFFEACVRLNKKRMMGDLVRGDSAFIIACQQTALDFSRLCRKQHLGATQGHLLLALGNSGRTAAKELRRHLCLDAPTFSRALSRLTDAGLVTRSACASKREIEIALTPQGLACATDIAEETTKRASSPASPAPANGRSKSRSPRRASPAPQTSPRRPPRCWRHCSGTVFAAPWAFAPSPPFARRWRNGSNGPCGCRLCGRWPSGACRLAGVSKRHLPHLCSVQTRHVLWRSFPCRTNRAL